MMLINERKRKKGKEEGGKAEAVLHDWEHQQIFNNPQRQEEHVTHCVLQRHGRGDWQC